MVCVHLIILYVVYVLEVLGTRHGAIGLKCCVNHKHVPWHARLPVTRYFRHNGKIMKYEMSRKSDKERIRYSKSPFELIACCLGEGDETSVDGTKYKL